MRTEYTLNYRLGRERSTLRSNGFRHRVILTVLASVMIVVGVARAADSDDLISRLQDHYRTTDSFTARFVETLTSPGGAPRKRTGKVAYRKPGMIRWEFDSPQPETIVADGTTLYDYDPGLNQVVEMSERSAFKNRSIAAFILGVGDLQHDFNIKSVSDGAAGGLAHLVVTPKEDGAQIELGVDSNSLNIINLRTTDALGNATELQLSDIQRNVPLETSQFTFTVPAGADIVNASAPH